MGWKEARKGLRRECHINDSGNYPEDSDNCEKQGDIFLPGGHCVPHGLAYYPPGRSSLGRRAFSGIAAGADLGSSHTVIRVPRPAETGDSAVQRDPMASVSSETIARPSPVPSLRVGALSDAKCRSKTRGGVAGALPAPSSTTQITTASPTIPVPTITFVLANL